MEQYKEIQKGEQTNRGHELICWSDGAKTWLVDGLKHRLDGPAYISPSGKKHWWLQGKHLTKDWFRKNSKWIGPMKAAELFEPVELVRLCLNIKK